MSLSDQERLEYMYFAVNNIYNFAQSIENEKEFKQLCLQAWSKLLEGNSNASHWVLGSGSSRRIKFTDNPWEIAVHEHLRKGSRTEEQKRRDEEYMEAEDNFMDYVKIEDLLIDDNSLIFCIYQWSEQLIYGLRRYDDEFLEKFKTLSDWVSEVQGQCFKYFNENNVFAKAYLLHDILEYLCKNEQVEKLFLKQYLWHRVKKIIDQYSLEYIIDFHKKIVFGKDNIVEKILSLLFNMGRRYHDDYKFEELIKLWPKSKTKILVVKSHNQNEYKQNKEKEEECDDTDKEYAADIYGYEFANQLKERKCQKKTR